MVPLTKLKWGGVWQKEHKAVDLIPESFVNILVNLESFV